MIRTSSKANKEDEKEKKKDVNIII
jgi:hypothetical protein